MEHREGHFSGVGGLQLYYQSWKPEGDPRAVLGILHGMGGHSSQYISLAEYLESRGYAACGFDDRGHGRSEGPRGHVDKWEERIGDLREEDPLWYSAATARAAVETLAAVKRVKAHAADLRLPLLINHGEKDRIALVGGAQAFFDAVTYTDKELNIYEGGYHDPFCDLDREQVLADLDDWMQRHL